MPHAQSILLRQAPELALPAALLFFALLSPVLAKSDSRIPTRQIRINATVAYGPWEGWGTSLSWMGNAFGDRDDLADALFTIKEVSFLGKNLPGLGLTIVRYNAGACTWNPVGNRRMRVSKIIKQYRQIEAYWLDPNQPDPTSSGWNWNADANQRAMLLKARDRGANRFELFSNSPVWWMCANDNPSGAEKAEQDNLPKENYPLFAKYLAIIARHARDQWGLSFTSVEPFNEAMSSNWFADCKQEGTHFDPESQAAFLPVLRAELDRNSLNDLPIAAADEGHYDQALKGWEAYSPAARAIVAKVNVHGYQLAKGDRAGLHREVVEEAHKVLWNSEHGDRWPDGLEMARNIHRDFAALHPSAWCYWQPVDDGSWAMIDADMPAKTFRGILPKYYSFAQYTRHVRPGMIILDTNDPQTIAAYSPDDHRLVLVVLNDGPARLARFELSGASCPKGTITSVLTTPKAKARYERQPDIRVVRGHFSVRLASDSIRTFEIQKVTLAN